MLNVHLRLTDAGTKQPTAGRVCVSAADGRSFAPLGYHTYFPCGTGEAVGAGVRLGADCWYAVDGGCEMPLPSGVPLRFRVLKGIEFTPLDTVLELKPGQLTVRLELTRCLDLSAEGWFSLDARCHEIPPHAAAVEAAAEDLAVVNLLVRNRTVIGSDGNTYPTATHLAAFSGERPAEQSGRVFVNTLNTHPALGSVALTSHRPVFPLAFGGADGTDDWSLCDWCDQGHRKGGLAVWVDPFRGDEPVPGGEALAAAVLGKIDAVEYGGGHRSQPFLPWYYRLWNAGVALPLAGASGKDSNRRPLGSMRTYCRGSVDTWPAAVKAGRTAVTNGPWLTCLAEGGRIVASASCPVPFEKLEIVVNGSVLGAAAGGTDAELSLDFTPTETSWVAARAVGGTALLDPGQTAFAHTSPQVVAVNDAPLPRRRAYLPLVRQCLERTVAWVEDSGRFEQSRSKPHILAQCGAALERLASESV